MSSKTGDILGKEIAGVNCILPHKHKTAWDLFLKGCANNWMPTEISMADDIKQWKNGEITDDENVAVKSVHCLKRHDSSGLKVSDSDPDEDKEVIESKITEKFSTPVKE